MESRAAGAAAAVLAAATTAGSALDVTSRIVIVVNNGKFSQVFDQSLDEVFRCLAGPRWTSRTSIAIFGPHALRAVRKLRLTGMVLGPSGIVRSNYVRSMGDVLDSVPHSHGHAGVRLAPLPWTVTVTMSARTPCASRRSAGHLCTRQMPARAESSRKDSKWCILLVRATLGTRCTETTT